MSGEKRDRILIALDGSEHAFEGVIYISRIPCFQRMKNAFKIQIHINSFR